MKKIATVALACLALASCSKKPDASATAGASADGQPKGHFTITAPKLPDDPAERQREQERLVESMVDSPDIDLGSLQGEAYRRHVKLTDSQIARKKANAKPSRVSGAAPAPAPAAAPPPPPPPSSTASKP